MDFQLTMVCLDFLFSLLNGFSTNIIDLSSAKNAFEDLRELYRRSARADQTCPDYCSCSCPSTVQEQTTEATTTTSTTST